MALIRMNLAPYRKLAFQPIIVKNLIKPFLPYYACYLVQHSELLFKPNELFISLRDLSKDWPKNGAFQALPFLESRLF